MSVPIAFFGCDLTGSPDHMHVRLGISDRGTWRIETSHHQQTLSGNWHGSRGSNARYFGDDFEQAVRAAQRRLTKARRWRDTPPHRLPGQTGTRVTLVLDHAAEAELALRGGHVLGLHERA